MPGTHNICSINDFEINASTARMIGRDSSTTIIDVSQCTKPHHGECGFSILAGVNVIIEKIKLINYSIRKVLHKRRNLKQKFHVKDCSIHKSSLRILEVELVNVEGCIFQNESISMYVTTTKLLLRNCI